VGGLLGRQIDNKACTYTRQQNRSMTLARFEPGILVFDWLETVRGFDKAVIVKFPFNLIQFLFRLYR